MVNGLYIHNLKYIISHIYLGVNKKKVIKVKFFILTELANHLKIGLSVRTGYIVYIVSRL